MATRTGDKVMPSFARPWWVTGTLVLGGVCLLAFGLWLTLRPPAAPDWRQAIADAEAAGDCPRVFGLLSSAASLRVPGAGPLWMEMFGRPILEDGAPACIGSWAALLRNAGDVPGAADAAVIDPEELEAFRADVLRFAKSRQNAGPAYRPPGTPIVALAALRGFEVLPGYVSGYRLEPTFTALSLGQRAKLAWLTLLCDAVWSIDRPNWRLVEVDIRGDEQGPWTAYDTRCGEAALDLAKDIGVDARGGVGVAVDMLLDYSGRLTQSRYLSAHRLLVAGIIRPYAAGDKEIIASLHQSAYSDLAYAILDGHGPSMGLYAKQLMNGDEQRYVTRRMGVLFHDPALSDTQYAYGLLTLAQADGEDVEEDLARAEVMLSELEKTAAAVWSEGLSRDGGLRG